MPILGGGTKGREWDTERSSISTNSSATSNSTSATRNSSTNKLSKFGARIRDSCRNLRAKQAKSSVFNTDDYSTFHLPNESVRSKVYVAMDFSGEEGGRVLDNPKDIKTCDKPGPTSKDGYVPFRRRVAAAVSDKLTETQATIHKQQHWFHPSLVREQANKILQTHANTDGVFLVRESSVAGGFVISYTFSNKLNHSQVLPVSSEEGVTYTLDEGRTKFYDLLQLVEFYQLNPGTLPTRLIHYIVSKNVIEKRDQTENGMVNGDDDVNKGEEEKTCKESTPRNMADSRKALECRDSLECEKMAASSASEGDSAMSQDGGSEDESGNREQKG